MSKEKVLNYFDLNVNTDDDLLLKKIHLTRLKKKLPFFFISFLSDKFQKNNDIRYFNELLWIVNGNSELIKKSVERFYSNYKNKIYNQYLNPDLFTYKNNKISVKLEKNVLLKNDIALVGNPFHFILPFFYFLLHGKRVDIINVMYHPNSFFDKILNSKLSYFIFKFLFGKNYIEIPVKDYSGLKSISLPKKYDVGFHKLSFIIKENLISSFRKGLINDHWGYLPYLKGRSSLLYSKLLGIKPLITNHIVDREIDSGKIIMYTPLNIYFIKIQIIFGLYFRIFKSVSLLCSNHLKDIDNKKGLIFYEMHPWLVKKIKN